MNRSRLENDRGGGADAVATTPEKVFSNARWALSTSAASFFDGDDMRLDLAVHRA